MMDSNYASLFPEGTTIDDETYFKMQQRQQLAGLQNMGGLDYSFNQLQQQETNNSFVGSNLFSSNHVDFPQLPMFFGTNNHCMQNMPSQFNHRQTNNHNFAGMDQNLSSVLPQGHGYLDSGINVGNYSSNMMLQQLLLQQAHQDNSLLQSTYVGNGLGGDTFNMPSISNHQITGDHNISFQAQDVARQLEMPAFEQQHYQPLLGLMTLQSLDASDFPVEKRRKTTKNRRDKNRPKQPLSAYNIFFKDERAKMLTEIKQVEVAHEEGNLTSGNPKTGSKRLSESAPGKIGFEKMAKTIARKWKEIAKDELKTYEARAAEDQIRYKAELAVYLEKKREEASAEPKKK